MTIDLWMLLSASALQWALIMGAATPQILTNGLPWAFGNRESSPPLTGWVARCDKCSANLMENLPIFAILVLVAHVSGRADALTGYGAMLFVAARLAHAGAYLAGVHVLRTGLWATSIVGWGLIAAGLAS